MQEKMITTIFELPGYIIIESLGIVGGISVRSRSIFGNMIGNLEAMIGGNISTYAKLCENTREEAFNMMIENAEEIGANAIVGLRYDSNEIAPGITEVLVYGTAVKVKKN